MHHPVKFSHLQIYFGYLTYATELRIVTCYIISILYLAHFVLIIKIRRIIVYIHVTAIKTRAHEFPARYKF